MYMNSHTPIQKAFTDYNSWQIPCKSMTCKNSTVWFRKKCSSTRSTLWEKYSIYYKAKNKLKTFSSGYMKSQEVSIYGLKRYDYSKLIMWFGGCNTMSYSLALKSLVHLLWWKADGYIWYICIGLHIRIPNMSFKLISDS